jgi:hypothetical protein
VFLDFVNHPDSKQLEEKHDVSETRSSADSIKQSSHIPGNGVQKSMETMSKNNPLLNVCCQEWLADK